jgi:SAM-dependent methyltransferase
VKDQERHGLQGLLHRLESRWIPAEPQEDGISYPYDPLSISDFLQGLRVVFDLLIAKPTMFLDVGCGIGTKLCFMAHMGFTVKGVEKNPLYAEAARELCPEADILCVDAFDLADREFMRTDILYVYRPMKDDQAQADLERHLLTLTDAGTACFFPGRAGGDVWLTR